MNNEYWKNLTYANRKFQISNLGSIKVLKRDGWKLVKPQVKGPGYLRFGIMFEGKKITIYIHRLVATAFVPNPENKPHVNHLNGNPSDNRVSNLQWCTAMENVMHAHSTNLVKGPTKMRRVFQLGLDGRLVKDWNCISEAAQDGFESGKICACCKGKRKQHKGYKWKYAN